MKHKPFKSQREEADFWKKDLQGVVDPDDGWEAVKYQPRATIVPRAHVYRVRLDDEEMAGLQALSKRKRLPASAVVRELILSELKRAAR